jgi:tripartite-type tricarboxylate transporter receptor subunit TctC
VKALVGQLAFTPVENTTAQFAAFVRSEIVKWTKVAKENGARTD